MSIEVGAAYVSILPSMKGFSSAMDHELGPNMRKSGERAGDDLGKGMKGRLRSSLSGVGKMVGGLLAFEGIKKSFDFLKDAVDAGYESNKIAAQTNAVIKSTGGVARVTAKDVDKLVTSLSNKTGVDDEAIQSGANMLLTFKNIRNEAGKGNDIFNQATSAITDLGTAMGTGPKQSAIMLGKALNDPIKGISALSRVGITFSKSQQEQIKNLVSQGKIAEAQKIMLKEVNSEVGGSAAAQATAMDKLKVTLGNVQESIGQALIPYIEKATTWFAERLPAAVEWTTKAVSRLKDGFVKNVLPTLKRFGEMFMQDILPALKDLGGYLLNTVLPVLLKFAGFLSKHKNLVLGMAAAYVAWTTALKVNNTVMAVQKALTEAGGLVAYIKNIKAVSFATKIWSGIQKAFNLVMAGNPIALTVLAVAALVAIIVVAYKKNEAFRELVQKVWAAIKTAIVDTWNKFIKPALGALKDFIVDKVIPAFKEIWKVVQPILSKLATLVKNVVKNYFKVYFGILKFVITKVLVPAFRVMWKVFSWAIGLMTELLKSAWRNIIRPIFKALSDFLKKVVGPAFRWLWQKVVSPIMGFIGRRIVTVWNKVIKPGFDKLKSGVHAVGKAFGKAKDAISTAWGKLKSILSKPIVAGIQFINNNLIDKVNWLLGKLGVSKHLIPNIPLPSGGGKGGLGGMGSGTFATGGHVGGYSPHDKADNIPAWLTAGEFVLPVKSTKRLRRRLGATGLESLRRGELPGFAGGGYISLRDRERLEAYRAAARGAAAAFDIYKNTNKDKADSNPMGFLSGWWNKAKSFINPMAGLSTRFGGGVLGQLISGVGGKIKDAAIDKIRSVWSAFGGGGNKSTAGWHGLWNMVKGRFPDAVLTSGFRPGSRTQFGNLSRHAMGHAIDIAPNKAIWNWLLGQKNRFFELLGPWGMFREGKPYHDAGVAALHRNHIHIASYLASEVARSVGGGAAGARGLARARLAAFGWGPGQFSPLNALWQRESGWNAHARNPSSGAYGIPQALPGSKMASAGADWRDNPLTQITWGLRYIKQRYGSPAGAWAHSQRFGWYANGGLVPSLFDQGGSINPGVHLIANKTRKPEQVLTSEQWNDIKDGGDINVTLNGIKYDSAGEVADELLFALKHTGRGKYSRRR